MNFENVFKRTVARVKNVSRGKPAGVGSEVYEEVKKLSPSGLSLKNKHLPYLLAQGGEHFVFAFDDPKHPDVVNKINVPETLPVVHAKLSGNLEKLKKSLDGMKNMMDVRREQLSEMRRYFGYESVPVQRFMIRDVPVSKELVEILRPEMRDEVGEISSIPAWVVVQRKVDMPREKTISLNGYYPESPDSRLSMASEDAASSIEAGNEVLLGGMLSEMSRESQLRWVVAMYPELEIVVRTAAEDSGFMTKLQDLAYRLVEFTQYTDIPLELAGKNNMVMTKGEDGWTAKLLDVLPVDRYTMKDFRIILAKLSVGGKLDQNEAGVALNILNTIRMVNALAIIADIPERFKMIGLEKVTTETWRKEFSRLFSN